MDGESSTGVTKSSSSTERSQYSTFRSPQVRLSLLVLMLLYAISFGVVIRAWSYVSVYVVAWVAFALVWASLLFRAVLRSHQSLQILLAVRSVDATDNDSPLADVLRILRDFSTTAVLSSFWSILALLMAIGLILSRR